MNLEEKQELRHGILDIWRARDREASYEFSLADLTSELSERVSREIGEEEALGVLYSPDMKDFHKGENGGFYVARGVEMEEESLARVNALLGKNVLELSDEDMAEAAWKMFTMSSVDYRELAESKGVELKESWTLLDQDSRILIEVLQSRGWDITFEHVNEEIMESDFGLGYFEGMAKGRFEYEQREDGLQRRSLRKSHSDLHRIVHDERGNLEKQTKVDMEMRGKHTIAAPVKMETEIQLGIVPFAMAFSQNNQLVVLGELPNADKLDYESSFMQLHMYDVKTGDLVKKVSTGIRSSFSGVAGFFAEFNGSLTAGSDGLLYVNGDNVYSSELEKVEVHDPLKRATRVLHDNDVLWSQDVYSVVENDGEFFFWLRPQGPNKAYNNVLVGTDGKNLIGEPISRISPGGGSGNSPWNMGPRMLVHGSDVYFKASKFVLAVDRGLSKEAAEKAFPMVGGGDGFSAPIPCHPCVSENGVVYVVSKFDKDPVQSIQGYVRGEEKGEFATHVYPEDHLEVGLQDVRWR